MEADADGVGAAMTARGRVDIYDLGTQVVAGTNYKLLCKGVKSGKAFVCIATVYADLDGNAEITDCGILDSGHYYEQEA